MQKWLVEIKKKPNAEWVRYNNLFNEGEDGFNPHEKYENEYVYAPKRQIGSKFYTVAEGQEMLAKLKDSLPKHTDAKKIAGCKDCIELFENHLKKVK